MGPVAFAVLVAVFVAAVGGAFVWHRVRTADQRLGQRVAHRLDRAARTGRPLPLRRLTGARFDRLVVIAGGSTAAEIRHALGFDWRRAEDLTDACCEPPPTWILARGHDVVAYFSPGLAAGYGQGVTPGSYRPSATIMFRPDHRSPPVRMNIVEDCATPPAHVSSGDFVPGCSVTKIATVP